METKPWYQSTILQQQIVQIVTALLTILGLSEVIDVETSTQLIFGGIAGVVAVVTAVTRIFKSHKPIVESVARKEEMQRSTVKSHWLISVVVGILAVLTLQSCSTLGVPSPQTFNEKLAVGYTTVTSLRNLQANLLESQITEAAGDETALEGARADAQNIQDQLDKAREALDIASDMASYDFTSAEDRLESAIVVLGAIRTYLQSQLE